MAARTERIVLVGLPGSGKSTVGPLVARRLSWRFIDLDAEIETSCGMRVAQIFDLRGEAEFRRIERELTERLAWEAEFVLAPGGGWIVHNQLPDALVVWLQVEPEVALDRLGEAADRRPLLRPAPLARLKELLAEREQYYNKAVLHIDTNGKSADQVADAVVVAVTK